MTIFKVVFFIVSMGNLLILFALRLYFKWDILQKYILIKILTLLILIYRRFIQIFLTLK